MRTETLQRGLLAALAVTVALLGGVCLLYSLTLTPPAAGDADPPPTRGGTDATHRGSTAPPGGTDATPPPNTATPRPTATPTLRPPPTLDDYWEGRADWALEIADVGLPLGESDTLLGPDGKLWSYLHASADSAGIVDTWGAPVPFPGCVTRWISEDGGRSFALTAPQCVVACRSQPCTTEAGDHVNQQQYPRVVRADDGEFLMVYEWGGRAYLRTSPDGLNWSLAERVPGSGIFKSFERACEPYQVIVPFPLLPDEYACLAGAPPGLVVAGDQLYVLVGMGKSPAHMGCFVGPRALGAAGMTLCANNPLFTGAEVYSRTDTISAAMNPYFDFHIISSADVLLVGERYYMAYEGIRGTMQFNLGFARSAGPAIDGPWEKFPGNPVLMDVPGNVGVGHGDLIVLDGVTYLYTATSDTTRGRYRLDWLP